MAKKKGGGHHGGAWKVAYADFVTAMMALFIVLWIIAPDPRENKKIVYDDEEMPIEGSPGGDQASAGLEDSDSKGEESSKDKRFNFQALGDELLKMLKADEIPNEKPVDVKVVNDSLRVTLYDRGQQPFFKKGTAELTQWGDFVLRNVAMISARYNMALLVDGHTAKGAALVYTGQYGPWDLSLDRAAAARRRLLKYELPKEQVSRISGYADTRPLDAANPKAPENQRVTIQMGLVKQ